MKSAKPAGGKPTQDVIKQRLQRAQVPILAASAVLGVTCESMGLGLGFSIVAVAGAQVLLCLLAVSA